MDQRIVEFIHALRGQGLRVSLAESQDAFRAIEGLGIQDKQAFRVSLRSTLVKNAADLARFDELFDIYFQIDPPQFHGVYEDLSPQDAHDLAEALAETLREFTEQIRRLLQHLIQGEPLSPEDLARLDQLARMDDAVDLRFREWKLRQMEQALRSDEVQAAIQSLLEMLEEYGVDPTILQAMQEQIASNQAAMQAQLRQHISQRILENTLRQSHPERADNLYNRSFENLTEGEMQILQKEVTRLATALRTRLALRQKRVRSGQLDVKSTLRSNLKYGSVPLEIRHRDHALKPKIVVLCDISTSMRHCSELMLSLLYAMQDQISNTHVFSFIDHLEYISPNLEGSRPAQAIQDVLGKMPSGHYNTDLGYCLRELEGSYLDLLDHRSTFIIVGDGRNNYNDPQLNVFRNLTRHSRSTIWLNPEAPQLWGSGDSDILKYIPYCSKAFQVNNLAQLAEAIDHLLMA